MTYQEKVAALRKWAKDKADRKNTLMYRRIADVEQLYIGEATAAIREALDTAAKFGVSADNDEAMSRVLDLVLGSRGIDTSEPAQLFPDKETDNAVGQMAQGPNGTVGGNQEASGGSRSEPGEATGSVAGQSGSDGVAAQSGSGRSRRAAGRAAAGKRGDRQGEAS